MDVLERVLVVNNATPAPLPQNESDEVKEGEAGNRLGNNLQGSQGTAGGCVQTALSGSQIKAPALPGILTYQMQKRSR